MSGKPEEGAQAPATVLRGEREDAYLRAARGALRGARLNAYYPEARLLESQLAALSPQVHHGLYDGVEIDLRSGLPSYKAWARVQADRKIASEALPAMPGRAHLQARAQRDPGSIHGKQLLKQGYFEALLALGPGPSSDMQVSLRRIDHETATAYFHVILDKLDVSGVFVRYVLDIGQPASRFGRKVVRLDDEELAEHTEAFRGLIFQLTHFDAEVTFTKLVSLGGLTVERVVKGCVGPFFLEGVKAPPAIRQMLEAEPLGCIASFSLDMAATDIVADRSNDPLAELLAERIDSGSRPAYASVRAAQGYHVFKDRKFVASPELVPAVNAFCVASGTRNIVYPLCP